MNPAPRRREQPTHYRLRDPLPLTITFPSVTYEVVMTCCPISQRRQLMAHDKSTGRWPLLSPPYHAQDFLELTLFTVGFPVRPDQHDGVSP